MAIEETNVECLCHSESYKMKTEDIIYDRSVPVVVHCLNINFACSFSSMF